MPGLILDRIVSVWRTVVDPNAANGYENSEVFSAIRAAIIPVSAQDAQINYSLQATHLVWVESWVALRKEDEVHWGFRTDAAGDARQPLIYVVNGRRFITQGGQLRSFFVSERE